MRPFRVSQPTFASRIRRCCLGRTIVGILAAAVFTAQSAIGATVYWDVDTITADAQDGGGNWTSGGATFWNGSTNVAATDSSFFDIAQFGNGGVGGTVNVSTQSIKGLVFGPTTTTGYTLTNTAASTLTIGSAGITMNSGAQAGTVGSANLSLALASNATFTNNSANLLTIGGALNNGGNTLTIEGSGNITTAAATGIISGAGGLIKNGPGTLTISAANTQTGMTIVNGGTIILSSTGKLSGAAALNINSGGTVQVNGGTDAIDNGTTVTLNAGAQLRLNGGATETIQRLSGAGIVDRTVTGTHTLSVSASSTTGNATFSGVIQNTAGTLALTKTNTNTFTLSGVNNTYTGTTTINRGTLQVASLANAGVASSIGAATGTASDITFNNNAATQTSALIYNGTTAATTDRAISITVGASATGTGHVITISNNSATAGAALTFTSNLKNTTNTAATSPTLAFGGTNATGDVNEFRGDLINSTAAGAKILNISKTGVSIWKLGGTNTYAGTTNITAGILQFGKQVSLYNNTAASWNATNIIVATGGTLGLSVGGTGEFTASDVATIAVLGTGTGGFLSGSSIGLDTTNATGNFVYSTAIANTNGGANAIGLTKLGTGTLELNVASSYSGVTTVRNGTLLLSGAGTLGNGAGLTMVGGVLDLGGSTQTVGAVSITGASTIQNGSLSGTSYAASLTTGTATISADLLASGAAGLAKSGAGILVVSGNNTFTGNVTVTGGILQFSTVSDNGGPASNLGQGTNGISLGGGVLSFIGSTSQTTNRAITLTASSTLDNSGTSGATLTYNGAITGASTSLTLTALGVSNIGTLTGGLTQSSTSADILVNSGTWNFSTGTFTIADDFITTGSQSVTNLNTTNMLTHLGGSGGASAGLYSRDGGTVNLNANDVTNSANGLDFVIVGDIAGAVAKLNTNTFNLTTPRLDVGDDLTNGEGSILGTGTITVSAALNLYRGTIAANLAGAAAIVKHGPGTLTFSGSGVGLTGTTTLNRGSLVLDYTTNNAQKLDDVALVTSAAILVINGSASTTTAETIGGLTLATGATRVTVNNGTGQTATLNLNAITRAATGGTVDFVMSSGNAIIQTSSLNGAGAVLGGYATVGGSKFATVSGGAVLEFNSTVRNALGTWAAGDNVTDSTGYTGSVGSLSINSLRFDAAGAVSTVDINGGSRLVITSGGILVTPNVGTGAASITGGSLMSGNGLDLIVHQNNTAATFIIASSIVGPGVTKSGAGTLLLSGINTFTGQTTISEGTLLLSGGKAIGDYSLVMLRPDSGVLLDLGNTSETIGALASTGAVGGLFSNETVAIGTGTLTINNTAATRTYQGTITGSGMIVKTGANQQSYVGDGSSFTGTVVIHQGTLDLSEGALLNGVTSFTVNGAGDLLSDQDLGDNVDHIGNSATITLNNTALGRGLWIRNPDVAEARAETVGAVTLGAGHNVIQVDTNGGTASEDQTITLTAASLTRSNHSTLLIRGQRMDQTADSRSRLIFTAAAPGGVGGGGAAGTTTMNILPYAIGEIGGVENSATLTARQGNSFMFAAGAGGLYRPLLTVVGTGEEYVHNETGYNALTGATTHNVRFVTNPGATLTGTATQINSLVLDSSAGALTVNGPASSLNIKSGAILATTTTAANAISLGGFTGLTTDHGNDFIIYVTNATNTFTLNTALLTETALVKSGAGTLVLTSAGSTFTDTYFNQGLIQVDGLDKLGSGNLNFFGGGLRWATGSTFDASTRTITLGTGGGTFDTNGNNVVFANAIGNGGAGNLTKAGAGILTLNAAVNFTGNVIVSGGTLKYGVNAALPTATSVELNGGTLDTSAFTTTLKGLTVTTNSTITGSANLTFTDDSSFSGGGARTLTVNNTGATTFNGSVLTLVNSGTTARTQAIAGTGAVTINSEIQDGTAAGSLTITNTNTTTLAGRNTYTGTTTLDAGTIVITADQNLVGALTFGSAATVTSAAVLDLSNASASFGGALTIQNNTSTANQIIIGSGETLSIGGNVVIGSAAGGVAVTRLQTSGGGSMVVNNQAAGATFRVGVSTSSTGNGSDVIADLSGLGNLSVSLNTTDGVFRVNPVSSTNVSGSQSVLVLPSTGPGTTTVTAATLAVGDSGQNNDTTAPFEQTNQLKLGSGVNTFHVNTVNIGTGSRDAGSITFNGGSGSLVMRDAAGTGAVVFNMGTGTSATGAGAVNVFDVSGHNADLLFGAVNIGTQTARVAAMTNVFSFDQGILVIASLNLSSRNTAGGTTSTFSIGGGTATIGTVTMATTGAAAGLAVANLNFTGGAITMTGNIIKGGGVGSDTANFLLSGNNTVLDMGGFTLGGSGANALDSVIIEAGTLKNLGEFNGGAVLVKTTAGTLSFGGVNTYTGGTDIQEGAAIAVGGADNRLGSGGLSLGSGTASATLQLGTAAGASNQTVSLLTSSGTGTANAIFGGNAAFSTLTVNQSANSVYNGRLGGAGANQNNIHFVKGGAGELVVGGAATMAGTITVNDGKLLFDGFGGNAVTVTSLTLADGTEFSLRGTSPSAHSVYSFSGSGNVIAVGSSSTGATLGFALDGAFNTRLNLGFGQTMLVNGTLTTAIYVNNAPTAAQYVLINATDDDAIFGSGGTFSLNPVVFNGGSFTYALSKVTTGVGEQWVLTPTAQPAEAEVWWMGDLTGIATGVWSASLTSGAGFPTNWAKAADGLEDALVPPDSGSIVHFSAAGAANFATTLGASLTIQELIFHAGSNAISIGSSGGTNVLTLGNTVDSSGLTMLTGAANVSIDVDVKLAQAQTWKIADAASTLTLTQNLSGVGPLSINDDATSAGQLILSGTNGLATYSGGTNLVAGRLILQGGANNRLPTTGVLTMGNATRSAVLQLGDSVNGASNTTIGGLDSGAATTNSIVSGAAAVSILTIDQVANTTFNGVIGGVNLDENNIALVKDGIGVLTLNGANTYTGGTTITEGTLKLGAAGSITGALTINADAGASAIFDLNGQSITLTGAITMGGSGAGASPQIVSTGGAATLTLGGNITYNGTSNPDGGVVSVNLAGGTSTRTITANDSTAAATDLTISGNYTNTATGNGVGFVLTGTGVGVYSGAITLAASGDNSGADFTKNGAGTWSVTGNVNVRDDFLINDGLFIVSGAGLLGNSNGDDLIIGNNSLGATVQLNKDNAFRGDDVFIRAGSFLVLGADLALNNAGGTSGYDALNIEDDATKAIGGSTLELQGFTAEAGVVTMGVISNLNVILQGNILNTGGSRTNTFTVTGLALRAGTIAANLTGTATLTKTTHGTVTLSGNNTHLGVTNHTNGTLVLDYSTSQSDAERRLGTGALSMGSTVATDSNALLNMMGDDNFASSQTVGDLTIVGGATQINVTSNGQVTTLNMGNIIRTGGTVNFTLPPLGGITTSASAVNGLLGGWATVGRNDFATVSGGSIVAATYTTQDNAAAWVDGDNITSSANFTGVADCVEINSLRFDATTAATLVIGRTLGITSGGILVTTNVGANASTITGGRLVTSGGEFFLHQQNTAAGLTIASAIVGSVLVSKDGAGAVTLSGLNTFAGPLNILEGVIILTGGRALGDTTAVNIRSFAGAGLTLAASQTETIGSLAGGGVLGGSVAINTGAVLTVNQETNGSFNGALAGAGTLVKRGAGDLTLGGVSTFTGSIVVREGLLAIGGNGVNNLATLNAATGLTVIKNGAFLIDNNVDTPGARLPDGLDVTLHGASGASGGVISGLWVRSNDGDTSAETIGKLVLASGASYIRMDNTGTNTITQLLLSESNGITRQNGATLNIRGHNLGNTSGARANLQINSATGQPTLVGGGTGAGTATISVIPWAIGESTGTTVGATNRGNSFLTYITGTNTQVRPLNTSTEYSNVLDGTTTATTNVRLTSASTGTTGAITSNVLVLDSNANGVAVTGDGVYTLNAGAILSTGGTNATSLSGFTGLATGQAEYIIFTQGSHTFTLDVALTTAGAGLIKSGDGTLLLNATNAYTGTTTINEGVLEVGASGTLGSGGAINFAGGTLKVNATTDFSTRTSRIFDGGGTMDTNGLDVTFNNIGGGGTSNGGLTKIGTGTLTLNGTGGYTGGTTVSNGKVALASDNALGTGDLSLASGTTLNLAGFDDTVANVTIDGAEISGGSGSVLTFTGTFASTGASSVDAVLAGAGSVVVSGGSLTVAQAATFSGFIAVTSGTLSTAGMADGSGANNFLILGSNGTNASLIYTGAGQSTSRAFLLQATSGIHAIEASGIGALTISGGIHYEGGAATNVLELGGTSTANNTISGSITSCPDAVLSLVKDDSGRWVLSGANTYTGTTSVLAGTLTISHASALGGTTNGTSVTLGAALEISNNITTLAEALSLNGSGISNGGALRNTSGTNDFTGLIALLTASRINSDGGVLTLSGGITGTNIDLTLGGAGNIVVSGPITTGTGTLTKDGAGTTTLSSTGNTYTGKTTVTDGVLAISSEENLGSDTGSFVADQITLDGGTLRATETFNIDDLIRGMTLGVNGGTVDVVSSKTLTYARVITGNGELRKTGAGRLVLNQTNTYTGATVITAGTLQVGNGGNGSTHGSSSVTVNGVTAVLAGTGTVNGNTTVTEGQIRPGDDSGNAVGTLSFSGNVTLSGSGAETTRLELQLGGASDTVFNDEANIRANQGDLAAYYNSTFGAGTVISHLYEVETGVHDRIDVTGTLGLNEGGEITVSDALGYQLKFGDVLDLLDFGAMNLDIDGAGGFGAFDIVADLDLPTLGTGLAYDRSLFQNHGILVVVPEPSRAVLLFVGLLMLALRRRRR